MRTLGVRGASPRPGRSRGSASACGRWRTRVGACIVCDARWGAHGRRLGAEVARACACACDARSDDPVRLRARPMQRAHASVIAALDVESAGKRMLWADAAPLSLPRRQRASARSGRDAQKMIRCGSREPNSGQRARSLKLPLRIVEGGENACAHMSRVGASRRR